MTFMRCGPSLLGLTFLLVCASPSHGQAPFEMTIHLGPNRELEVKAEYHDPVDIDQRLKNTRVIPMLVSVTNSSGREMPLDYGDVTLDVGSDGGVTRLAPVDPARARNTLRADGQYNNFISWIGGQGDRFTTIDPFSRVLRSGPLPRGEVRKGYVFFLRPERQLPASFLALGMASYAPEILKTNAVDVMSPDADAAGLWPATMKTWPDRFRAHAKELRESVGNVIREIASGAPPYRKSYALLMGVSDYAFMERLPKVKTDLDRMSALLRSLGFTVVRIENDKLTMANVKSPQDFFANVANIGPEDRLLVFFAGHGFQRSEGGRVRGYLALANSRNGEPSREHTIAMDDFVLWTERVRAKHLLVLLESCFSGLAVHGRPVDVAMMGAPDPNGAPNPQALYQLSKDPGRYLLMAGDENQRVPMGDAWGGGLFADAVIKGLGGRADGDKDGFVTARELYPWVRSYVETEAMKVLGTSVTPLIKDLDPILSKGEFVFTTRQ